MENLHKDYREHGTPPGGETAGLSPEEIRALIQENENLRQELRIRDNDILSHDQVFDSIVSGTLHVILVMSVTTFRAEFITSNLENALGVQTGEALEDVRRISPAFEDIEKYDRREETFIHRTNGSRRQYLIYVIHLPYGRSDRVAVVLLCTSNAAKGDLEEMMLQQTQDINRAAGYFLASMSHDFRVPISSISGFVMLLMKNAENPSKVREYAHRIGVACQEIMGTVDQILDMSRIGSGDLNMESEEFGLGLMLEEVCRQRDAGKSIEEVEAWVEKEKQNFNNLYKDSLRSREIEARQALNRLWQHEVSREEVETFFRQEVEQWQLAATNYRNLEQQVQSRALPIGETDMTVQWNPSRIVSTAAKVDAKSIEERPCFLCDHNRPKEQHALKMERHYQILVNPFPILPRHFTIPSRRHTPQSIWAHFSTMRRMAWTMPEDIAAGARLEDMGEPPAETLPPHGSGSRTDAGSRQHERPMRPLSAGGLGEPCIRDTKFAHRARFAAVPAHIQGAARSGRRSGAENEPHHLASGRRCGTRG